MSFSFLQSTIFAASDLETYLMPITDENPIEQLLINLFPQKEENCFLHLAYINDILQDSKIELKEYEDSFILQFYVALPFSITNEEQEKNISSLLTKINAQIPLGSFGINETQLLHYRYYLVSEEREIEPQLIIQLSKQIKQIISNYIKPIEQVIEKNNLSNKLSQDYFKDGKDRLKKSIFDSKYLRTLLNQKNKLHSSPQNMSEYLTILTLATLIGGAIYYLTEPLWGISSLIVLLLIGFTIYKKRSQRNNLFDLLSETYHQIYTKSEIFQNNQMKLNGQLDRLQKLKLTINRKLSITLVETTEDQAEQWKQRHTLAQIVNQIELRCQHILSKRQQLEQEKKQLKIQQEHVFKKMEELDSISAVQQAIKTIRVPNSYPSYKSESGLLSIQVLLNHLDYSNVSLPWAESSLQYLMVQFKDKYEYWLALNFEEPDPKEEIEGVYLVFSTFLPVEIKPDNLKDYSHFLIWINRILSIGSFGIYQEKYIYYKYSLFLTDHHIEATSIIESLELINFFLTKLGLQIIEASQNQNDLHKIAKSTEDAFTKASNYIQGNTDIEDDSLGLVNDIKLQQPMTIDNPEQVDYSHLTLLVEDVYKERDTNNKSPSFNRLKSLLIKNQEKTNYSYSEIYAKLKHYESEGKN